MLHYTLESDRGKISESSSGLYKTDLSFSKSFFEGLLPGLRHSIFLWFHSIMVEQEGLPSCEHPPENCEFPLKKKNRVQKRGGCGSVYRYAHLGVNSSSIRGLLQLNFLFYFYNRALPSKGAVIV